MHARIGSDRRETICAIASGTGGGIGIVRLSGPEAEAIGRRLVASLAVGLESHRLVHGLARDPDSGEPLDEVLACVMRAPRSYTGETVVELHGHGGAANLERLLDAAMRAGARVADPGEFTRRAFLAGRMDLTRAEAVAEVIAARSSRAVRLAQAQLRGEVSAKISSLRERLVALLAEVEARVDFPDERLDFVPGPVLAASLVALADEAASLAATQARGRLITEGMDVALVGRTNAGKSSLLNALAGEERALVDAAPGTTRDFVEVEVEIAGVRVKLVDTAGERDAVEDVERRGLELGRRRGRRADVVLVVVDGQLGFGEVEARLVSEASDGVSVLVAWNKADLQPAVGGVPAGVPVVATSALAGLGLDSLRAALALVIGGVAEDEVLITSARQRDALDQAVESLRAGAALLAADQPPELAAVDLRLALDRLGRITGDSVDDAVLDAIFARFCIGK